MKITSREVCVERCPGMVGPFSDGEYYCVGKEYGFCDQRSSTCWCNKGYEGLNCTQCIPEYYKHGGLCYPKKNCPSDCSGQGTCDYATGKCTCNSYRFGLDCSQQSCHRFDMLCTSCTAGACLACLPGYFPITNRCLPCSTYDPRCITCDDQRCLSCGDFILNSVRRSGARAGIDPSTSPLEEPTREFSFLSVYGSQHPQVFDEAEPFGIVRAIPPSLSCTQGTSMDASFACVPLPRSHVICGHSGTLSFSSPTYEIAENAPWIPVTVTRTGGGVGSVAVTYELIHLTTSDQDVSATAFYTSSQRLEFLPGVTSITFFITIHDNFVRNENKEFLVALRDPTSDATLGNQDNAVITILDNEPASPRLTVQTKPWGTAGTPFSLKLLSSSTTSASRWVVVEAKLTPALADTNMEQIFLPFAAGSWLTTWTPTRRGNYSLSFFQLFGTGLRGHYFANAWLQGPPRVKRVDRALNFTWATDKAMWNPFHFGSARWSGYLQAAASELTYFRVVTTGSFRLWLNGKLVIDAWLPLDSQNWGAVVLEQNKLYSITFDYRHGIAPSTRLNLQWQSASIPLQSIPTQQLFVAQLVGSTSVTILPSSPVPNVIFQGNTSGVAGAVYSFAFYSLDGQGNLRRQSETEFRSVLTLQSSPQTNVDVALAYDPSTQKMLAQARPVVMGLYSLQLFLNQVRVTGFPIDVQIASSPFAGPRSDVFGPGVAPTGVIAAARATMTIRARDLYGNTMSQGGAEFTVRAVSGVQALVDLGTVVNNLDGTYTAWYIPRFSGAYSIEVLVNKMHVAQSPYAISVAPNEPFGPSSHLVSGLGLTSATTGLPSTFVVQLRDVNGNLITAGSAAVTCTLATSTCVNMLNGQYSCTYTPTVATPTMVLSVQVNSMPIKNSPFVIPVTTGAIATSTSVANGTGLLYSFAGQVTKVNIQAKDIYGNNRMGADTLTGQLVLPNGAPTTNTSVTIAYLSKGYHELSYQVFAAGSYLLRIQAGGQNILNSPFTISIYPGPADIVQTTASFASSQPFLAGTTVVAKIEPKDAFGNPVNQPYLFRLSPQSMFTLTSATNAVYTVALTPTLSGVYTFQPQIYLPGGGNVTLYKSRDWSGPSVLFQTPMPLGANYGLKVPPLTDAMRDFSAVWRGYISATYSELYTFHVTASGCHVRIMLNKTEVVHLTKTGIGLFSTALTAASMMYLEIWVSKASDAGPVKYKVTWSSLSQPEQDVPASSLFSLWRVTSLSPTFSVFPNAPFPPNFELSPMSPTQWTAGTSVVLTVVAKDAFGNVRDRGGDSLQVLLSSFNQQLPVNFNVQDIQDFRNGTYGVRIVSFSSGNLSLTLGVHASPVHSSISVYGFEQSLATIRGNPFLISVAPAIISLESTVFTGPGLVAGIAGVTLSFSMALRDAYLNAVAVAPSGLVVFLTRDVATSVVGKWTFDVATREITVAFVPEVAGIYAIKLQLGTATYTPLDIQPLIRPNVSNATTSQIVFAGPALAPFTDQQSFSVVLYDAYGNPVGVGGDRVAVTVNGAAAAVADVVDNLDGTYQVHVALPSRGVFEITTLLMQPNSFGLAGKYYPNTTTFTAEMTRIDRVIDLTGIDTPKIEWTGFLLGTFTETFQFDLVGCRLFIDNVAVPSSSTVLLIETHLHVVRVESFPGAATIQMRYQSARTPAQIVPSTVLFPTATEIGPRLRLTGF
ncbi:hypothetical protein, variant [Aphanomyces invadans]|uniref:PA14 domain-containing protein n=1 Tax=Aphanomyces invadans TaxID=157072 RepID=A0A024TRA5_9STRA|nr:hypothetical protein, variant [Aphanomyces invadans]ETV96161.1 hypothetical protein, variant [Aphanomyces invadans]|eukprot:XP_008874953.1 hypothetical protein, variant [Aphanomyces invadans]